MFLVSCYEMSYVRQHYLYMLTSRNFQMPRVFQKSLINLACTLFVSVAGIFRQLVPHLVKDFMKVLIGSLAMSLPRANSSSSKLWFPIIYLSCQLRITHY